MLIDTHTHISKEDYDDINSVINSALNNKVERIIISGCEKKTIVEGLELIDKYGVENLSMRKLAEKIGVSNAAPYAHFENKEAFLDKLNLLSKLIVMFLFSS